MKRNAAIILGLLLGLWASSASAQNCSGQAISGAVCGNAAASTGFPSWNTQSALLDRAFGSSQGTILNRGASLWSGTSAPALGLNGGSGGQITLNGSTSGSAQISVQAAAGTATLFQLPNTNGTINQVLITDGSGHTSWTTAGAGTVSSVGLALPASILTVSGSPVTGAGTLTGTLATQSANLVWAGPTTGAAATPTFRSLVGADLPNPAASTLGGIESFAAVGSQWIRQISTSGVPTASQPAFTDISGTASAAQLPNPTASTLGGIESLAAVTSKWINTISTSGVPSATQPAFTDISGQATLAQLPTIGNSTLLSNISGGSATPLANTLTAIIDSVIGSTQGQVLYRSGTVWTALSPGTSGQVLTTSGAAANPSWTTVTGTGTVTSVATNNGLTGGPITTTGTIGLATISTGNVLGNVSGISAVPTATTPTQVLDVIGATQGSVLYRGASVWTALTPGTNGQFLQTTGAGSTPQWASAVTSLVCGGVTVTTTGTCPPSFGFQNCSLAASVGSNLLTVALKDNAGSDPSAGSPCNLWFRSPTAATGSWVQVTVTGALSISSNATGATLGSSNSTAFRFWVVAFNNAGTTVLALYNASTFSTASGQCSTIDETQVQTSTPISGSATLAGTYYTPNGTTVTSKSIIVLGYVEYNATGLATAGTYASGPNFIQTFGPGVRKPCEPVQRQEMTTTSSVACNNNSSSAITATNVTKTITPTSAANLIKIFSDYSANATATVGFYVQLFRGSGGTGLSTGPSVSTLTNGNTNMYAIANWDKPNTTSSTAYLLQCSAAGSGSGTFNLPAGPSVLEIEEIMG